MLKEKRTLEVGLDASELLLSCGLRERGLGGEAESSDESGSDRLGEHFEY
jgi:hypothetical protein